MSEAATSDRPWLLGSVGTPLIPPSWVWHRHWHGAIALDDGSMGALRDAESLAAYAVVTVRNADLIDWPATAAGLVAALSGTDPHWLTENVANPTTFEGWVLGDLPLRTSTFGVLEAMRLNRAAPLENVVARRRAEFGGHIDGWAALLDLCVTLECWWPYRRQSAIHGVQHHAHSLEDIAAALMREYLALDGDRLGEEWVGYVLRRNSWGVAGATLDAIGRDAELTRERVRQILVRLESLVGVRQWPLPEVLASVLEEVRDRGFRNVQQGLLEAGLVSDDDWTPEELVLLLEWFGYPDLATALAGFFDEANRKYSDPNAAKAIRNARSKIGLVRLDSVALPDGTLVDPSFARDIARMVYSRVFEAGGWLLAGDASPTMLESSAGRQFHFARPLDGIELYEGLIRVQKGRSLPAMPSQDIVLGLLAQAGAIVECEGGYEGPTVAPDAGSLHSWLAMLLLDADGAVLHKETINRAAIQDRINISSLGHYYLYSPITRSSGSGRGLVRLVGRTPTEDQLDHASHVAEVLRAPTTLEWGAVSDCIHMTVSAGSTFLGNGVLSSTAVALVRMWPEGGADIACMCDKAFTGHITVYGSSGLIGWAPLLSHLVIEHSLQEGQLMVFELRGKQLQLTSLVETS